MDIHYNAFISYRHHPQDIKVAEQIHRSLEHYRVPKALRKKQNTKLRLFRDKEELPITSNLTDDITRALENSDYLIVICSSHTKESIWVQREIETFLQTHDHSRVLTVLADGEPYETIPEILCRRQQLDPVTGQTVTVPIEPLSCDWRIDRRKARREELPRLASTLLGCGYDELRQRERQYRMRRLVTVFSLALAAVIGFTSYVAYNSSQIRKANRQLESANAQILQNLEAAQVNQSQYLSSASETLLEEGDRMLAMALAMEALPDYPGQRPYVAQAESALGNALGAYWADPEIAATGSIHCDALVTLFEATNDRKRMYIVDQRQVLSVWDLENFQKLNWVQLSAEPLEMFITADGNVLLRMSGWELQCYDRELNQVWAAQNCVDAIPSDDRASLLVELSENRLAVLSAADGSQTLAPVTVGTDTGWSIYLRQDTYDLSRPVLVEYNAFHEPSHILSVDLTTGQTTDLGTVPEGFDVRTTGYTAQGDALVLTADEDGVWNSTFGQMMTHSRVPVRMICYRPTGGVLWTTELTTYGYSAVQTLYAIDDGSVFCQIDNLLVVINTADGSILSICETGASPIWVSPEETQATILMEDGAMGIFKYNENQFHSIRYFKENLADGFGGHGAFVRQQYSTDVLIYGSISDENWQIFSGEYSASVSDAVVWGHYAAIYNYDAICLFDVAQQKLLWTVEELEGQHFQLLGFTDEGSCFWFGNDGAELICLNIATGEQTHYPHPEKLEDGSHLYHNRTLRVCLAEGKIYSLLKNLNDNSHHLHVFDTASRESRLFQVCQPAEGAYSSSAAILHADGQTLWFWENSAKSLYRVDVNAETVTCAMDNLAVQPSVQYLEGSDIRMLATDNRVLFYRQEQLLMELQLEDQKGVSAYYMDNQLLLLTDAGTILRYGMDGAKLGEFTAHLYTTFFSSVSYGYKPEDIVWTKTADGDLFVSIFNAGNLIDTDSWELRAWIPNCLGCLPELNQVVTSGTDPESSESRLGAFPLYTLEQIQDMAATALKGYTLTPEQKEFYGLD